MHKTKNEIPAYGKENNKENNKENGRENSTENSKENSRENGKALTPEVYARKWRF